MMTNDVQTLIPILLSNFVTVRFPRISPEWEWLPDRSESEWRRLEDGVRGELLISQMRRTAFRIALAEAGHRRFLDPTEGWLSGDCRIHFFFADQSAISVVYQTNMGIVGPGDPVNFNPIEYIEAHLCDLEKQNRLTSGDRWWDFDE